VLRIRIGRIRIRIQHFLSMRIRIQIQDFDDQKLEKNLLQKKYIFLIKNCNLLIPRPPKRTSRLQDKSLSPQKRTSGTLKLEFSSLFWVILALLDPDPDPYADPDPADRNECGSGSATLEEGSRDISF
jgi:hypothetical protein